MALFNSPQSVMVLPSESNQVSENKNPDHQVMESSWSIPQLLEARRTWGANPSRPVVASFCNRKPQARNSSACSWDTNSLSSRIAWNPSRLRNMILAVGPGTPASVCWKSCADDDDDDDDDDDWSVGSSSSAAPDLGDLEAVLQDAAAASSADEAESLADAMSNEDDEMQLDDSDEDDAEETSQQRRDEMRAQRHQIIRRSIRERSLFRILRRRIVEAEMDDDVDEGGSLSNIVVAHQARQQHRDRRHHHHPSHQRSWLPSIRHGGCINTACWLDSPWRLSAPTNDDDHPASSSNAVEAIRDLRESPTQLVTSGDDRLVKFWDVRDSMGMVSPLSGGWDTFVPLGEALNSDDIASTTHRQWKHYYKNKNKGTDHRATVAGSVRLLATLVSGHRGNVFHVTPIDGSPGKVLTCGADGYLRMSDMQSETSTVVVNPFARDGMEDDLFRSDMAFSHLMTTDHTGLLCSRLGLHHFDVRLPPREQQMYSLLSNGRNKGSISSVLTSAECKACALWSPHGREGDPTMVFAGGGSEYVELLDLRMDASHRNVLQRYKPRCLQENGNVSVSGLDVTKDGQELLVSYESDQVYSFPVFHDATSLAGPTLNEIDDCISKFSEDSDACLPEIASYGGHLNRFTFLKNAKYAGPQDDYVITGSDSGNAWIYERKNGTVVSLLGADSSTCNGVIPHPSLPFFITYGIDSTAKLWRAAPCVDRKTCDSPDARAAASLTEPYDMSPVTRSWDGVQALLKRIDEEPDIMPDFVASSEEIACSGRFSSQACRGICGEQSPRIGNGLRNLPRILRQNRYECYRAHHDLRNVPVEQPLVHFSHRVSMNRLRHQALRHGVGWNPLTPWAFEVREGSDVHRADLVPDHPGDWLLFDGQMREDPLDALMSFNTKDYPDVLRQFFPDNRAFFDTPSNDKLELPWLTKQQQTLVDLDERHVPGLKSDDGAPEFLHPRSRFDDRSRKILYETAVLLKEGGNQAVKQGLLHAAARRYDKAIQYCAVAFMQYQEGMSSLKHLTEAHHVQAAALKDGDQIRPSGMIAVWSPLLRILITSRLNMSLLLVKPEFAQPHRAADQARAALKLLYPFARREGKIVCWLSRGGEKKKEHVVNDKEPVETYREAKALQTKAYFRLGSAELDMGDYSGAIKSLESSLKSSSATSPNKKPDSLLIRRLQEAKRKRKSKKKRARKRFQMFPTGASAGGADSDVADPSDAST